MAQIRLVDFVNVCDLRHKGIPGVYVNNSFEWPSSVPCGTQAACIHPV